MIWSKERVGEEETDEAVLAKVRARFCKAVPLDRVNLFLCRDLLEKLPEVVKEEKKEAPPAEEEPVKEEKKGDKKEAKQSPAKKQPAKK